MLDICHQCGQLRVDKTIDPSGPFAVCPECGYPHPFLQLPLRVVAGASGTGKSTVLQRLVGQLDELVLLESDILWRAEFNTPETRYRDFFETWLCMAKNIHQSGRPVMLFGAGMGVPENLEPCLQRRYFSRIHYLALVCDEAELRERLLSRPEWRGCANEGFLQAQVNFNRWFVGNGPGLGIELVDTTHAAVEETTAAVVQWSKRL